MRDSEPATREAWLAKYLLRTLGRVVMVCCRDDMGIRVLRALVAGG